MSDVREMRITILDGDGETLHAQRFDAGTRGEADAVARAIEFLSARILPLAIQRDARRSADGELDPRDLGHPGPPTWMLPVRRAEDLRDG